MLPIEGGLFPLPTTWWTPTGDVPSSPLATNPSYAISMGIQAQLHWLQDCPDTETVRIWGAFVNSVDINLQGDFIELFPYAEFNISQCGDYQVTNPDIGNRKVFSYCPPNRSKPFEPSVPIFMPTTGSFQFQRIFRNL